ncbi:MAG: hypothetical protein H0X51_08205 [Parachlamydiaceae bacterium]|nr:hypothetical protein [Parachlamydiaceae bacterium]
MGCLDRVLDRFTHAAVVAHTAEITAVTKHLPQCYADEANWDRNAYSASIKRYRIIDAVFKAALVGCFVSTLFALGSSVFVFSATPAEGLLTYSIGCLAILIFSEIRWAIAKRKYSSLDDSYSEARNIAESIRAICIPTGTVAAINAIFAFSLIHIAAVSIPLVTIGLCIRQRFLYDHRYHNLITASVVLVAAGVSLIVMSFFFKLLMIKKMYEISTMALLGFTAIVLAARFAKPRVLSPVVRQTVLRYQKLWRENLNRDTIVMIRHLFRNLPQGNRPSSVVPQPYIQSNVERQWAETIAFSDPTRNILNDGWQPPIQWANTWNRWKKDTPEYLQATIFAGIKGFDRFDGTAHFKRDLMGV